MSDTPFLVHKAKFTRIMNEILDYMDDKEKVDDHFVKKLNENDKESIKDYLSYMKNGKKSTGLFNKNLRYLSKNEKENLQKLYELAEKNNSVHYLDLFSFDNKKLEEVGLYDSKRGILNERAIMEAASISMDVFFEKHGIKSSAMWTGSFHYNTDNIHIHIHISTIEPYPTQQRGKKTESSMDSMKSSFANYLLDYSPEQKKINNLIRDQITKEKNNIFLENDSIENDRYLKFLYKSAIDNLPSNKRHWQYGYNKMKKSNYYIDKITEHYLNNYKLEEYKELNKMLDVYEGKIKYTYGEGQKRDQKRKVKMIYQIQKNLRNIIHLK